MSDKKSEVIQICGLWTNETKDGKSKFMKGNSGQVQYLVFKNKNKTEKNHPDYYLCLSKNNTQKKEEGTTTFLHPKPHLPDDPVSHTDYLPHQNNENITYNDQDFNDEDIPF